MDLEAGAVLAPTDRTRLRRKRDRGSFDRTVVDAILDEGLVAHVGFGTEHGPVVLPMAYARIGDQLYLHGASGNAMLRQLAGGAPACVTVTLLDGVVLARSAFKHSMNYRCVVLYGRLRRVTEVDELLAAAAALVDHLVPGRSADARPPSADELRATSVLALPIVEGSAKVRTGGPVDDASDLELPVWAGVVPLAISASEAVPDGSGGAGAAPELVPRPPRRR